MSLQSLYWKDLLREGIDIYPFEIWLECMLHYLNAEKWLFHTTTVTCNQMKMDTVDLDFHRHIELEEETPNLNFLE
jgi:hypothetical protein